MRGGLLAGHPDQLLAPHHLAARKIVHAGDERDVDIAALDQAHQRRRERAIELDLDARKGFSEHAEDLRQHEGRIEVGRAEHDLTLDLLRRQLRNQFVMQPQDGFGVGENRGAVLAQRQPAPGMLEQLLAGELLQPLQLQGDRRLGAAQPSRGLGDAAGLDHRDQRTEHADIETDKVHAASMSPRIYASSMLGRAAAGRYARATGCSHRQASPALRQRCWHTEYRLSAGRRASCPRPIKEGAQNMKEISAT